MKLVDAERGLDAAEAVQQENGQDRMGVMRSRSPTSGESFFAINEKERTLLGDIAAFRSVRSLNAMIVSAGIQSGFDRRSRF